jgi:hypothetical protein
MGAVIRRDKSHIESAPPEDRMIVRYALQGHPTSRIMALTGRPAAHIERVLADPEAQHWIQINRMAFEDKFSTIEELLTEAMVDGAQLIRDTIKDDEAKRETRLKAAEMAMDRHPSARLVKRSKVEQAKTNDDSERKNVLNEIMVAAHALKQSGEYKQLDDAVEAQFEVVAT